MPCLGCGGDTLQDALREMGVPAKPARIARSPWAWRSLSPEVEARVDKTLQSAVGTPYVINGRQRGVGLDCRTSIAWFLDTMERRGIQTPLPSVRSDVAIHDVRTAAVIVRALIHSYHAEDVTGQKVIEPGDIIGVRYEQDGQKQAAHGMIAGVKPNTAFHAPMHGYRFTQTGLKIGTDIVCVYRTPGKEAWA